MGCITTTTKSRCTIQYSLTLWTLYCYLLLVEIRSQKLHPKTKITFREDIAEYDYQNDTYVLMTNANPSFDLNCEANYPVQWVIYYSKTDDGTSEQKKQVINIRHVTDFTNSSTYIYSTRMLINIAGKILLQANFSCQYVTNAELMSSILLIPNSNGDTIELFRTSDQLEIKNNPSSTEEKSCHVYSSVSNMDSAQPCWNCFTADGKQTELDFFGCQSDTECQSKYKRQNRGKRCLRIVDESENGNCKQNGGIDYRPNGIVCKSFGPALAQLYYYGVSKNNSVPNMYFDWSDIDSKEMIYIHPIEFEIYFGQTITITCELSKYYFAFGAWFGVEYNKMIITYSKQRNRITEEFKGTFITKLKLELLSSRPPSNIYCFGPIWNSTEWINTSVSLDVKNGIAPLVTKLAKADNLEAGEEFWVSNVNKSLRCTFLGDPAPNITWIGPPEGYFRIETNLAKRESFLTFPEVTFASAGEYKCLAESFLGSHSKTLHVNVNQKSPLTLILSVIGVSVLIIGAIIGFVLRRQFKIILAQREAIRVLTEAEIEEFRKGNSELKTIESSNSNVTVDALPYDSRYELSPAILKIDYDVLLGSGHYGKVYKGRIKSLEEISHYINLRDKRTENADLEVAIKTCHAHVDVVYFKALLSEIKVMAFIGQNPNIVSLIGACTEDIRKRQVFIAVEYCSNGSLENILRKSKTNFLNYVKYGILINKSEPVGTIQNTHNMQSEPCYTNVLPENELNTINLLSWTHDIASGMEYLQYKKVIHGDLAVRNILISADNSAKIGDFGLSRQLIECSNYVKKTQCPLPWRYMSPESLRNFVFSVKSDIWSFGITCWEIFTLGETPYPGQNYSLTFLDELEGDLRLSKPVYATNDVYEYMLKCWNVKPDLRPDYIEIRSICKSSLEFLKPD